MADTTILPPGTKVAFPDDKDLTGVVLGPGDKDFDKYGTGDFDYLLRIGDARIIRRATADEIVAL